MAQALHGIHHVIRLGEEGITQALHPDRILAQSDQHLGKRHQCLHARVPGLLRHLLDRIVALGVRVGLGPGDRLGDFPGIGHRHQQLGQQRVGVQRDGRDHLIQLFLIEHWILGGRRCRRSSGRTGRCRHSRWRIRRLRCTKETTENKHSRHRIDKWNAHCNSMGSVDQCQRKPALNGVFRRCKDVA